MGGGGLREGGCSPFGQNSASYSLPFLSAVSLCHFSHCSLFSFYSCVQVFEFHLKWEQFDNGVNSKNMATL